MNTLDKTQQDEIYRRVFVDLQPLPFWRRWFCKHEFWRVHGEFGLPWPHLRCGKCGKDRWLKAWQ